MLGKTFSGLKWVLPILLVLAVGHLAGGESPASAPVLAPTTAPGMMGKDVCLSCHTDKMKETLHSRLHPKTPRIANLECEACHGPGEGHVTEGGAKDKIRKPTPKIVKDLCAGCHPKDRSLMAAWNRDPHHTEPEISCVTCHDIHAAKLASQLVKPQKDPCLGCHPDVGAQFSRPFHHPLGEGQLECVSCHEPHTNDRFAGRPGKKNELCVKCHTEVKGPFTWEHKAVTDDQGCLNCHQPHGGTSRKLLKQSDNQMCLQCHQDQLFVPSIIPGAGGRSEVTIEHSRRPALQGKCAKCHGSPFSPLVGLHNKAVTPSECSLCHTEIKGREHTTSGQGVDHTRFIAQGRCVDCHTDIHGSNHSRKFLD